MKLKLKPIAEQTIVITGATSGIGLVTARMAAEAGAQVVLIARNETALRRLTDEINRRGGAAVYFAADVADEAALEAAADLAQSEFGGFDTWVNNAGVSVFGRILEVPTEDLRRVIETNLWGVVNGSRVAARRLRKPSGKFAGAIINLGSEVSDRAVPLQGIYTASKHAIKAFTDALRMEVEADQLPISVSLVKPGAIGTPWNINARNYLPYEPKGPQPVWAPELVAEAILTCAERPTRDVFVGESAKINSLLGGIAPRLTDYLMERNIDSSQNSGRPRAANRRDGLFEPNSRLQERDPQYKVIFGESPMQRAWRNPLVTGSLLLGGTVALAALYNRRNKSNGDEDFNNSGGNGKSGVTNSSQLTVSTSGQNQEHQEQPRMFPTRVGMIYEHVEVVGSDDEHVGVVDEVEGDHIKLTKNDRNAGGKHHLIMLDDVESTEPDKVRLKQTATEAVARWQTT